jgi:hypothetical protein
MRIKPTQRVYDEDATSESRPSKSGFYRCMSRKDRIMLTLAAAAAALYGNSRNMLAYFIALTIGYLASGDPDSTIRRDMLFVPPSS